MYAGTQHTVCLNFFGEGAYSGEVLLLYLEMEDKPDLCDAHTHTHTHKAYTQSARAHTHAHTHTHT